MLKLWHLCCVFFIYTFTKPAQSERDNEVSIEDSDLKALLSTSLNKIQQSLPFSIQSDKLDKQDIKSEHLINERTKIKNNLSNDNNDSNNKLKLNNRTGSIALIIEKSVLINKTIPKKTTNQLENTKQQNTHDKELSISPLLKNFGIDKNKSIAQGEITDKLRELVEPDSKTVYVLRPVKIHVYDIDKKKNDEGKIAQTIVNSIFENNTNMRVSLLSHKLQLLMLQMHVEMCLRNPKCIELMYWLYILGQYSQKNRGIPEEIFLSDKSKSRKKRVALTDYYQRILNPDETTGIYSMPLDKVFRIFMTMFQSWVKEDPPFPSEPRPMELGFFFRHVIEHGATLLGVPQPVNALTL